MEGRVGPVVNATRFTRRFLATHHQWVPRDLNKLAAVLLAPAPVDEGNQVPGREARVYSAVFQTRRLIETANDDLWFFPNEEVIQV